MRYAGKDFNAGDCILILFQLFIDFIYLPQPTRYSTIRWRSYPRRYTFCLCYLWTSKLTVITEKVKNKDYNMMVSFEDFVLTAYEKRNMGGFVNHSLNFNAGMLFFSLILSSLSLFFII